MIAALKPGDRATMTRVLENALAAHPPALATRLSHGRDLITVVDIDTQALAAWIIRAFALDAY